ncbi:MAG: isoaspartyl peptidase/L-asparaginase, partial [Planctomycetota bacterium]
RWQKKQAAANTASSQLEETNVRESKAEVPPNHDTIALLGLDASGNMFGGCSTSGLAYKLPGRVGDSPIIGSGLYVDGDVGAAGATGVGENIMRYCATFLIVEFMRQGKSPTEACEAAIRRIGEGERRPLKSLSVNFVAINKEGHVGAAGTDQGFRCAIVDEKQSLIARPKWIQ